MISNRDDDGINCYVLRERLKVAFGSALAFLVLVAIVASCVPVR